MEDDLINRIKPEWNKIRINELSLKNRTIKIDEIPKSKENIRESKKGQFKIKLHKTYYNAGFFNVPVKHDKSIGADKEDIEIYVGNEKIKGYINRTANLNQTARIFGGSKLKDWFQNHFTVGDEITISLISKNSISINKQP